MQKSHTQNVLLPESYFGKREKIGETRFFPQFKMNGYWIFAVPVKAIYGFMDIESCEQAIVDNEDKDVELGNESLEWRIKEEEV